MYEEKMMTIKREKNSFLTFDMQTINNFTKGYKDAGYDKVDIADIFKRYQINNYMDLTYNILKNINRQIDKNSSESDIIDQFVFDDCTILYPFEKMYFFTGYQYGYAGIWNEKTIIELKVNDDLLNIIYDIPLTKEQIIEIVSSLETKF